MVLLQETIIRDRLEAAAGSGVIERVCRARIRIRVRLGGREKVINVVPDNVISEVDVDDATMLG
jgi:hypothetical protein